MSLELHLLEYHQSKLEYLQFYKVQSKQVAFQKRPELRHYSLPQRVGKDLNGYDGTSITDNMVTDVYAQFSEVRQKECEEHLRMLTGASGVVRMVVLPYLAMAPNHLSTAATTLSLDATFHTMSKASIIKEDRSHSSIFNGRLHTAINQKSLIVAYVHVSFGCF